jgi:hypothetical protein
VDQAAAWTVPVVKTTGFLFYIGVQYFSLDYLSSAILEKYFQYMEKDVYLWWIRLRRGPTGGESYRVFYFI